MNTLILSNTPHEEAHTYKHELEKQAQKPIFIESFIEEELKIEHAHEIRRQSVLCYAGQKFIIIAAHHFNVFAQNALLKILEEPPPQTHFILIARSKHALLSTLLSRLTYVDRRIKTPTDHFDLDLRTCNAQDICNYLQELDKIYSNPEEIKVRLYALLRALQESALPLPLDLLQSLDSAVHANGFYYRPSYNLLPLLLRVLELRGVKCF
ncbi:DNA polymerase III subunit delta' [Helicobacter cynogastricus]|uniref:DNA polymerase III subunit delta' n=1 Tax=Helicobacter cynogastricus TaxID=329937 RepID=UPI000CF09F4B|nr:DNA polymerase III subunit delta' [Helicobacter cynogastricus]